MHALLLGLAVGLASAAPLGPQNAYLLRVGLQASLRRALGATALVVGLDVSVSLTGLALAGSALAAAPVLRVPALALGAVVLVVSGVQLLRVTPPGAALHRAGRPATGRLVAGALAVTWLNPAALLDGSLLFGGLAAGAARAELPALVVGLCSASVLWSAALLAGLRASRARLAVRGRRRLERAAGAVVLLLGLRFAGQAVGVL